MLPVIVSGIATAAMRFAPRALQYAKSGMACWSEAMPALVKGADNVLKTSGKSAIFGMTKGKGGEEMITAFVKQGDKIVRKYKAPSYGMSQILYKICGDARYF